MEKEDRRKWKGEPYFIQKSYFYKARPTRYKKGHTTIYRIPKNLHFNENLLKPKVLDLRKF